MKQEFEPEEWLGFVFEFIRCVDEMARVADGTVVKRIGDELMLTFNDVQASARFVDSLVSAATSKYIGTSLQSITETHFISASGRTYRTIRMVLWSTVVRGSRRTLSPALLFALVNIKGNSAVLPRTSRWASLRYAGFPNQKSYSPDLLLTLTARST
jgi:hypothetical protein